MIELRPLKTRQHLPELLDQRGHPDDLLYGTFEDMRRVNSLLGGTAISLRAVRRLTGHLRPGDQLVLADIGIGHGDIARNLRQWAREAGIDCRLIGIDLDQRTIKTAKEVRGNQNVTFLLGDMLQLPLAGGSVDIAFSSMTLHHVDDGEAVNVLREMARISRLGIVVNDLVRTLHGYIVAWILGRLATRNRLTRHDAHRSIRRGRTEADLAGLARLAGLNAPVFDSVLGYRTAMTIGTRSWQG